MRIIIIIIIIIIKDDNSTFLVRYYTLNVNSDTISIICELAHLRQIITSRMASQARRFHPLKS